MSATYEKELWDGIQAVYARFDEGRKTVTDMLNFLGSRAKLEEEYAKKLQALASKPNGTTESRSLGTAWSTVKSDHEAQQRLRYTLSQTISKDLVNELSAFKKEITKQRDVMSATASNLTKDLDKGRQAVQKAKAAYHKAAEAAEGALTQYERAQQDPTFPPKTLTKLNGAAQKLKKESETADAAYQSQVQDFQQFQEKYEDAMKAILNEFQMMEERRMVFCRDILEKLNLAHDQMLQQLVQQQQQVTNVCQQINGLNDVQEWIQENRTGLSPSKPTEYEPYKWKDEAHNTSGPKKKVGKEKKSKSTKSSAKASRPLNSSTSSTSSSKSDSPSPATNAIAAAAASRAVGGPSSSSSSSAPAASAVGVKARALFEYAAADDTEISFDVDDIIMVLQQDSSGWWSGENRGHRGLFPSNYCQIIEESAPAPAATAGARRCRVLFDFAGDNDDELSIKEGQIITIDTEAEGWYSGTNEAGESGLFPANYTEEI